MKSVLCLPVLALALSLGAAPMAEARNARGATLTGRHSINL